MLLLFWGICWKTIVSPMATRKKIFYQFCNKNLDWIKKQKNVFLSDFPEASFDKIMPSVFPPLPSLITFDFTAEISLPGKSECGGPRRAGPPFYLTSHIYSTYKLYIIYTHSEHWGMQKGDKPSLHVHFLLMRMRTLHVNFVSCNVQFSRHWSTPRRLLKGQ